MAGKITNAGRDAIRDFVQSEVAEMGVGTGTTDPTKTNSSLESEVTRKSVSKADGATGETVFKITLSTSDANYADVGAELTEVGTFDADGNLQARLTHSGIRKTSDFEVEYRLSETVVNT
ncbi:hypothetical protein [Halorussus sp. MSC15.2]|uniref:hypothetical protein n=1 Tax=Halorussus sp. MSC15.2 TaxID=2283638 RepID=UPI0013D4A8A1|nr:hypothetical protein [Halorussus sp. MSC15.2]NEU57109.1 hypothetical protein [Halorussus sp. MSC15.2]